ncbi:hypothetical protein [Phragmitibacter flavus]|nr:hypothetical protein [Phragmitibacter flavus]
MSEDYHRHDVSDRVWADLEPRFHEERGSGGGDAHNNRQFINAMA